MNFIETNFLVIASSLSETLLSAMDITIAINTNREIKISTYTCTAQRVLEYSLWYCHFDHTIWILNCNHVRCFLHPICSAFYNHSKYLKSTPTMHLYLN